MYLYMEDECLISCVAVAEAPGLSNLSRINRLQNMTMPTMVNAVLRDIIRSIFIATTVHTLSFGGYLDSSSYSDLRPRLRPIQAVFYIFSPSIRLSKYRDASGSPPSDLPKLPRSALTTSLPGSAPES